MAMAMAMVTGIPIGRESETSNFARNWSRLLFAPRL